jgi:hypothetical protein
MSGLPWDAAKFFDDRSAWEIFFFPYPRKFSDFDDVERLGLFVPRWHHGIYALMWAVILTHTRHAFNQYVWCVGHTVASCSYSVYEYARKLQDFDYY